jgi:predicted nucleic-acid-binding Zn-ribbon protein
MGKITCAHCGYTFEEKNSVTNGKSALLFGITLGTGLLVGGPIGAAIGGVFGKMISSSINRGVKEVAGQIINRCPKCGANVVSGEKW